MSDNFIEKKFLYLLLLSLLLHVGAVVLVLNLPEPKQPLPKEPVFIDLQQMPEIRQKEAPQQREVPRLSERRMRVERERAPRAFDARDRGTAPPVAPSRPQAPVPVRPSSREATVGRPGATTGRPENQVPEGSSSASLLKPKRQGAPQQSPPRLFPTAGNLARLEDTYRRKFERDIAEGDTKFLNSDDIQFGSFLRRFENSVYGVWRYPGEAARSGTEGVTPVRITFNRKGEVVHVQLLETSGSAILDDEVFRTLRSIGPVGTFPKGYDKDVFHLIAFFQYGLSRRSLR